MPKPKAPPKGMPAKAMKGMPPKGMRPLPSQAAPKASAMRGYGKKK